ncbi:hypothetical protein N7492_008226 [Penicillium capsulatum]|uniref:Uncharacterized protein n=1 Tax=Penicillium capsulatum TaxID=69766 RepID=A0A9W9HPB2_9EURO|nr:hypothetical protein N7492_008226 [Penicillium capsulatum]KAJ6105636.1 hypothetical protein N7512_009153 [Penicillium capsulatum]
MSSHTNDTPIEVIIRTDPAVNASEADSLANLISEAPSCLRYIAEYASRLQQIQQALGQMSETSTGSTSPMHFEFYAELNPILGSDDLAWLRSQGWTFKDIDNLEILCQERHTGKTQKEMMAEIVIFEALRKIKRNAKEKARKKAKKVAKRMAKEQDPEENPEGTVDITEVTMTKSQRQ